MAQKLLWLSVLLLALGVNAAYAQEEPTDDSETAENAVNAKDLFLDYPRPGRRPARPAATNGNNRVTTSTVARQSTPRRDNNRPTERVTIASRNRADNAGNRNRNNNNVAVAVNHPRPAPSRHTNRRPPSDNVITGLPGTKLRIELLREGRLSFVAPNSGFRSGDRIRLRFATNFEGYITVTNIGSSGRFQVLYPYRGADNQVQPTADYQIPQAGDWITFDDQPGTETLTVIMSQQPLNDPEHQSRGAVYAGNTRTGRTVWGKDLFIGSYDNTLYAVCEEDRLAQPIAFSVRLKHR